MSRKEMAGIAAYVVVVSLLAVSVVYLGTGEWSRRRDHGAVAWVQLTGSAAAVEGCGGDHARQPVAMGEWQTGVKNGQPVMTSPKTMFVASRTCAVGGIAIYDRERGGVRLSYADVEHPEDLNPGDDITVSYNVMPHRWLEIRQALQEAKRK
jgi:hypothetical protein